MLIEYITTEDGSQAAVYGESWSLCIVDGKWMRCAPTDPRSANQLCHKGAGVDKNYSRAVIEKVPIAPKLTDKEREAIEEYNKQNFMPYGQRHLVRREEP